MSDFVWTDLAVRRALGFREAFAEESVSFSGVSTDSRATRPGELFVALVGDRYDGHEFVVDALARGARGAVVSRAVSGGESAKLYPVDDTLVALGALAAFRRSALDVPVIAITGSAGKTTTKDFTAAAVGAVKRVHATRANLNNRVGMPLTLLAVPEDAQVVVLELGSNEPGEIRTLGLIARPDVAVITTVGESHLEKLGSFEGVLDEKLELLRCLAAGGRCVVGDEPEVLAARARSLCEHVRVVGWSQRADPDFRPSDYEVDVFGRYEFSWRGHAAVAPMPGRHAVTDALLALAVADLLGIAPQEAVRGLATAKTSAMRTEVRRIGDLTVIVDCYNANPQSVRAAFELLEDQGTTARHVAVLGTMLELGAASDRLHDAVLADALGRNLDLIVATGGFEQAVGRLNAPDRRRIVTGSDWEHAYPILRDRLKGDEFVLLKASRGMALEGILPLLESDFGAVREAG